MITAIQLIQWATENQATVLIVALILAVVIAVAVLGHLSNKHGWNERMKNDTEKMKQERLDKNERQ